MNLVIWIIQGLLAAMMIGAGMFKINTPRVKLAEKMHWAKTWTDGNVKLLGLAEVLGAAGLILPGLLHLLAVLTPVAAICLAILMAGAAKVHLDFKESPVPAVVPLLLAIFVAIGRLALVPWVLRRDGRCASRPDGWSTQTGLRKSPRLVGDATQDRRQRLTRIDRREDAFDAIAPHDDHRTVLVLGHDLGDLVERRVTGHDERIRDHRLIDTDGVGIELGRSLEQPDIVFGDDPDETTVAHHRQVTDLVGLHQATSDREGRRLIDRHRVRCHETRDRRHQHARASLHRPCRRAPPTVTVHVKNRMPRRPAPPRRPGQELTVPGAARRGSSVRETPHRLHEASGPPQDLQFWRVARRRVIARHRGRRITLCRRHAAGAIAIAAVG